MATTTNFGWETPDDTDLVKDGALAIRTLGSAIDTSLVDLKGGTTGQVLSKTSNTDMDFTWVTSDDANAIQNAIVDAKGDLITATAADTPARLAVGTNGQYLSADSSTATGLNWVTPTSGGGMTLLSSTTLSGSSTTISSISQDYTDLYLFCNNASISSNAGFFIYFNGDTTATNYRCSQFTIDPTTINGQEINTPEVFQSGTSTGWNASTYFVLHIPRYSVAENHYAYGHNKCTLAVQRTNWSNFVWNSTSAITSIAFANGGGRTWSSGTVRLYGVK